MPSFWLGGWKADPKRPWLTGVTLEQVKVGRLSTTWIGDSGLRTTFGLSVIRALVRGNVFEGVRDLYHRRILMSSKPTTDHRDMLADGLGSFVTRSVLPTFASERYLSVLIGETTGTKGAAHHNYVVRCATFDRRFGRRLKLRDLLGRRLAHRLLAGLRRMQQRPEDTLQLLGNYLTDSGPFESSARSFLLRPWPNDIGPALDVVLCLEATAPSHQGQVLLVHAGRLPLLHLLRKAGGR